MNNFIDTTAGSTYAVNVAIQLYMPPAEATTMLAICDRMQALEAQQPDPDEVDRLKAEVQRLTPDHAHARQCRTAAIETLVLAALDNATLRVDMLDATRCRRTKMVRDHLRKHKDRYNITKPPTHASVRTVLIKLGYV
jgi:hypothetical protein